MTVDDGLGTGSLDGLFVLVELLGGFVDRETKCLSLKKVDS